MAQMFDEAELLDRVDNDMEFLADTVQMLADDGPTLVEQVRGALAAGDASSVGKHAHALKGMISNFCAPDAQACALEVEKMGKAGDLSGAPAALAALEQKLAALTDELREFVKAKA